MTKVYFRCWAIAIMVVTVSSYVALAIVVAEGQRGQLEQFKAAMVALAAGRAP